MKKSKLWLLALSALVIQGCAKDEVVDTTAVEGQTETVETVKETITEPETTTVTVETVAPIEVDGCLKDEFAKHNMKVGTCLTTQMIDNPKLEGLILSQFNSITMENAMKPDYIFSKYKSDKSGDLVVELSGDVHLMLQWAREHDMAVRGHTLVWYSQTPDWIFYEDFDTKKNLVDRDTMLGRMESMIKQMFEQLSEYDYIDSFYAYDIVNEAWLDNGSMRDNNWRQIIGDDYLWYAFYYADKYAPESIDLYYNDYNEQYKTNTLVDFVKTLVDEDGNYLIDGIGLQAHLYTQDSLDSYFKTVDTISELGIKVQLTELDVCLGSWQTTLEATDENLSAQADFYRNLMSGIFERVDSGKLNTDALTFWGFVDSLSWRKAASPLLFDYEYKAKPSYYAVLQK